MAYTDLTTTKDFQALKVKTDFRANQFQTIQMFKDLTSDYVGLTPELINFLQTKMQRDFTIPVIPDETFAVTTHESFVIPANYGTTGTMTATTYTHWSGFRHLEASYNENQVASDTAKIDKLMKVARAIATAMTTQLLSIVDANKSQVFDKNFASNDGFSFAASAMSLTKGAQEESLFMSILDKLMKDNNVNGDNVMLSHPGIFLAQFIKDMYGANNDKNIQEQFPKIYPETTITNADRWTAYLIEKGSFGIVPNIPFDYRNRKLSGDGWQFGTTAGTVPFVNDNLFTLHRNSATDASGHSTNTSAYHTTTEDEYGFGYKYTVLAPYNRDITSFINPVVKVKGLTA